jgi:Leucine-rich repeat (LRR) protein
MKNLKKMTPALLFFLACIFTSINTQAQDITFVDPHFKSVLVANPLIDLNGDGEIQKTEANAFVGPLDVSSSSIFDMREIEHFINLIVLDCSDNFITTLNLNNNLQLVRLACNKNMLHTLEIVNCTELRMLDCNTNAIDDLQLGMNNLLEYIACNNNKLNVLDVIDNTELRVFDCSNNQINYLDLSQNVNLTAMNCANNQLSTLNVANNNNGNIASALFDAKNNNLQCIEVDDPTQATQNWNTQIDAWSYFGSNCMALGGQNVNTEFIDELTVYPNPVENVLTVDLGEAYESVTVEIYNALGALVMTQNFKEMTKENINLSLNAGIYTIRINTPKGQSSITRLVKK